MAWWLVGAALSAVGSAAADAAGAIGSAVGDAAGAIGSGIGQAAGAVGSGIEAAGRGVGSGLEAFTDAAGDFLDPSGGGVSAGVQDAFGDRLQSYSFDAKMKEYGIRATDASDERGMLERMSTSSIDRSWGSGGGGNRQQEQMATPNAQIRPDQPPPGRQRMTAMPPRYAQSRTMAKISGDRDYGGGGRMMGSSRSAFQMPPVWDPGGYFDSPRAERVPYDVDTDETGHVTVPVRALPGEIVGGMGRPDEGPTPLWTDRMSRYRDMPAVEPDRIRAWTQGLLSKNISGISGNIRRQETQLRRGRLANYLEELSQDPGGLTEKDLQRYDVMASRLDVTDAPRVRSFTRKDKVEWVTGKDGLTRVKTQRWDATRERYVSAGPPVLDTSEWDADEKRRDRVKRTALIGDWEDRTDDEMYELFDEAYPFNEPQGGDLMDMAISGSSASRYTPSQLSARQRYEDYKNAVMDSRDDEKIQAWLRQHDRLFQTQLGNDQLQDPLTPDFEDIAGEFTTRDPTLLPEEAGISEDAMMSEDPMLGETASYGPPVGQAGGLTSEDPRLTGEAPLVGDAERFNEHRRDTVSSQILRLEMALAGEIPETSPMRARAEQRLSELHAEREGFPPTAEQEALGTVGEELFGDESRQARMARTRTRLRGQVRGTRESIEGMASIPGQIASGIQGAYAARDQEINELVAGRSDASEPLALLDPETLTSYDSGFLSPSTGGFSFDMEGHLSGPGTRARGVPGDALISAFMGSPGRAAASFRPENFDPEFRPIWTMLRRLSPIGNLTITAGTDSHGEEGKHPEGRALDIRTNTMSSAQAKAFEKRLRNELGSDWYVEFEEDAEGGQHIHVQLGHASERSRERYETFVLGREA